MALPRQAVVCLRDKESEWRFEWSGFDGDDRFHAFGIAVTTKGTVQHYDFGVAPVFHLRKLSRFFRDQTQGSLYGDSLKAGTKDYDVFCTSEDYRLVVCGGGDQKQEEFHLKRPEVILSEFLKEYDGDRI